MVPAGAQHTEENVESTPPAPTEPPTAGGDGAAGSAGSAGSAEPAAGDDGADDATTTLRRPVDAAAAAEGAGGGEAAGGADAAGGAADAADADGSGEERGLDPEDVVEIDTAVLARAAAASSAPPSPPAETAERPGSEASPEPEAAPEPDAAPESEAAPEPSAAEAPAEPADAPGAETPDPAPAPAGTVDAPDVTAAPDVPDITDLPDAPEVSAPTPDAPRTPGPPRASDAPDEPGPDGPAVTDTSTLAVRIARPAASGAAPAQSPAAPAAPAEPVAPAAAVPAAPAAKPAVVPAASPAGPEAQAVPPKTPPAPPKTPPAPPVPPKETGAAGSTFVPLRTDGAVAGPASAPPAAPAPEGPPRSPLELLAELTNKQAPKQTPLRGVLRRIKIWSPLVLLLVVVLAVAQLLRPLPDPELVITAAESYTFDGELGAVPWPEAGQAALDVDGVGTFGSAGEREAVPIASVAKTMTAYVILREHPMSPDEDGAVIEIDQQAQDDYGLGESRGDSVVDVRAGDTITQREALQALMIASGNNVAWLLARWHAGSVEDFVAEMNAAAAELGMTDTVYTDPSGFDLETVSTAADQVKLGRAAMADPVLRQIVGVSEYTDQYGQTHPNGNTLVPVGGVAGIKTGSRTAAGGNFLFAARQEVNGEGRLIVGAVLSQPPHPSDNSIRTGATTAARTLIDFAQERLRAENVLAAGDVVGHVDDGLGGRTPLVVAEDVPAVGWDGLTVRLRLTEDGDGPPRSAEAGTVVGRLTVGDGDGAVEIPVQLQSGLTEPGLTDKLLRLG